MRDQIAQLRTEMNQMVAGLYKWLVATTLTMVIAFGAFFIGLGNLVMSRLPPLDARTGASIGAPPPITAPVTSTVQGNSSMVRMGRHGATVVPTGIE
jgi:hypothetical protein